MYLLVAQSQFRRNTSALAIALLSLCPLTAEAQSPSDRAQLERFRDLLAVTWDSGGLLSLEQRLIDSTKADRNNGLLHLKLGFLSLRMGDLGGYSHYDDAASEFQWAIDLQPSWPYSWYGMGLAEYGVGNTQVSFVTGIKTMLGKGALARSAVAFARSAEVDLGFVAGLVDLANTGLRERGKIKLGVALEALRRAGHTTAGNDPDVLLARGRVEREVASADSALAAFEGYLQVGPNRGLGLLETARTLFLLGRFEGVTPYFEGAASEDTATIAGYRADLATISPDTVLQDFDQQHGPRRAAFLRRFWGERDRLELRTDGERLREHYRRLFYARRRFQLVGNDRHYGMVEHYRSGSRDFDDRGVIYIRHGEPSSRATYAAPGLEPNESWRYSRPDGDLIFHFITRENVEDFKLVESLFDVLGSSQAMNLVGQYNDAADDAMADQLLLSREQLSPIYRRLQQAGPVTTGRYDSQERRVGQESIAIGTTSDSYELRFPRELKTHSQVLAVGRDSSGPKLQVAYAIAGSSLDPVTVTRGLLYSVRLRFVATDTRGQVVSFLDTTRHFVTPAPVPSNEHLVGRVSVTVPPGMLRYRLAIQQGEAAGVTLPSDSVRVGPRRRGSLSLSDLVLGSRSANLVWRPTEGDTVLLNPVNRYKRSDEMDLYYEIEGLRPAPYTVKVSVRKKGSRGLFRKIFGGGTAIKLKFEELASAPQVSSHQTLLLSRLKPGTYLLQVQVTDADGRKDRRSQEFKVVEEKGAGKRGSGDAGKKQA